MIELKARNIALAALALTTCIPEIPVLFASFFHAELLTVRKFDPAATTIALLDAVPVSREAFAVDAAATYAGISFSCLDKFFVRDLKNAGLGVVTYTLNDPRDIAYACSLEVDAIVSDFPDRLPSLESRT
jgi:glycerophosphoryl diester phosphodiesterase